MNLRLKLVAVAFACCLMAYWWLKGSSGIGETTSEILAPPSSTTVVLIFATLIILWIMCFGARAPGARGGGGPDGNDRVHRVYPPSVIALGAILPPLFMSMVGAIGGGVVGFLSGLAIGFVFAFATLLYLLSSPEYSSGLIDL